MQRWFPNVYDMSVVLSTHPLDFFGVVLYRVREYANECFGCPPYNPKLQLLVELEELEEELKICQACTST